MKFSSIAYQYREKWLSVVSVLVSQVGGDFKLWGPQVVRADCIL